MPENLPLFSSTTPAPLAERLRPKTLDEFMGIEQIDSALRATLAAGKGRPPSLILWGPPGCGKTTLAKLIGKSFRCRFVEFSAVMGGVKEIREIVDEAGRGLEPTLLFVDEIHRFNKGQQDAFLPHVERGTISLIGATTENPSFSLNSALLSRARVVVLSRLDDRALAAILARGLEGAGLRFEEDARAALIQAAGGDARRMLNFVEQVSAAHPEWSGSGKAVSRQELEQLFANSSSLFYDRSGDEHYNMASAFIKSMRGSDPDAAMYWGLRMIESGEDPRFITRRMIAFAAEDVSNADPRALQLAVATAAAYEQLGLPEGRIPIAQCITYLACAPKSNRSYVAMHRALDAIKQHPAVAVPLHLRNAPTALMKSLNYGREYQYPHDYQGGHVGGVKYLPDELGEQTFYEPSDRGYEKYFKERLEELRKTKP